MITIKQRNDTINQYIFFMLMLWVVISLPVGSAMASGVQVKQVSTHLDDNVYYLDAQLEYVLTEQMLEALHKSVSLTFVLEIEVIHERKYLWDSIVARLEQRYQLDYLPLTQQYQVRNLNSGSLHNLPSLQIALSVLGAVLDLPLLDQELLASDEVYVARLRAQLDIEELPVPLRLLSYFADDWRLRSEWFAWSVQH